MSPYFSPKNWMMSVRCFASAVRNLRPRDRRVLRDFFVYQFFNIANLLLASVARLKNQTSVCPVRRNSPFAKHRARQLRATPNAANASRYGAPGSRGVDRHRRRCARLRPVRAHDLEQACGAMNENVAAFLRIDHAQLTDFGAIVPGHVEQPVIAYLSAHLGVKAAFDRERRRLLQILPG